MRTAQSRVCDALTEVSVSMAAGNVIRFRVEGCTHYTDGSTHITGMGGEKLVYPSNGGTPYLLAGHVRTPTAASPSAPAARQLSAKDHVRRQLAALGDGHAAASHMHEAAEQLAEMAAVLHRRKVGRWGGQTLPV